MYLYRKDKNGQRKNTDVEEDMVFMNETKEYKAGGFRNNKTLTGISIIVILAAIAIVYLFIGVLFMGAGKEKDSINVEHTSADDYNKWDTVDKDDKTMNQITDKIRNEFVYLRYAPILFVSAKNRTRTHTILPIVEQCFEAASRRIITNVLNEVILDAQTMTPAPLINGKRMKIYYASQVSTNPPTIVLFVNDPKLFHFSY